MSRRILVTGGAGYIGSMLCTYLVKEGFYVTVIDKFDFSRDSLNHLRFHNNFDLIEGDITSLKVLKKHIKNKDFIIPLAALVGAPLCDKFPKRTIQVNVNSIKKIMKLIKKKQKIIYLTTNSGYGIGDKDKFCDESSPLRPVSLYGRTKNTSEKIISSHPNYICYRLATVFGYSYRMRTDVLVNNFVLKAVQTKKIDLFEPNFRRNYIHVRDVVRAILFTINNFNKMKGNIYNLGLSSANLTKKQLSLKIKNRIKDLKITIKKGKDPDKRDYFVSNKKIEKLGFFPIYSIEQGIDEMINVFQLKTNFNNNY